MKNLLRTLPPGLENIPVCGFFLLLVCVASAFLITGCVTPIGATRVSLREGYAQVERNALTAGEPGPDAEWIIRRYGLDELAKDQPEEGVRQLHSQALRTGDRDIL